MPLLEEIVGHRQRVEDLAEGRISPHVDVQYVYDYLFRGIRPPSVHESYCVRSEFLSLTCTTEEIIDSLRNIIEVLAGKPMKNVFIMPAYFGAGKSHFLALLIHVMALYREHNGSGEKVSEYLKRFGIELSLPSFDKVPNVVLYHGERIRRDNPPWSDISPSIPKKDEVRRWVEAKKPLLIIFDETGMIDNVLGRDFADYIQMLSEVVSEMGAGYVLIASYSSAEEELRSNLSFDRLRRVGYQQIELKVTKNIIKIYRRWAKIEKDPSYSEIEPYLKGSFEETKIKEFYSSLKETYPFNPETFEVLKRLSEESLAKATKIQLTRGLLQHMMRATINAIKRRGELIIHADLPDPKDVIVPPKEHEKTWYSLGHLYSEDLNSLKHVPSRHERIALESMMKYVFFMSFIGRLLPRGELYPDENRLVLSSFDPSLDFSAIINAQRSIDEGRYRVQKTAIGYIYLPLTQDIYDVVKGVVDMVADDDGFKVITHEVEQIIKSMPKFDYIVVVGWRDADKKEDKLLSFADSRNAEKFIEEHVDNSILIVALKDVKIRGRNNLAILKPKHLILDEADAIRNYIKSKFKISIDDLEGALVFLGRVKFAADEVLNDLQRFFPDIVAMLEEWQRRAMEEAVRAQVNIIKDNARSLIKSGVEKWLHKYILGFKEYDGNYQELRKSIVSASDKSVAESILNNISSFTRIGDLWSQWLNNSAVLGYPINFSSFVKQVLEICRSTCNYVIREGGAYYWLSETGGSYPDLSDPKNAEIAPAFMRDGNINEPVVEEYLKSLQKRGERVFIEYVDLNGLEHSVPLDQFISSRTEWIYLRTARIKREKEKKEVSVTVNGREELIVNLNPREKFNIDVSAKEPLSKVLFEWQGQTIEGTLGTNYRSSSLQINAPEVPGEHMLNVKVVFADGYEEERRITVRVRGRSKTRRTKITVDEGAELIEISVFSASDSDYVLQRFRTGALSQVLGKVRMFQINSSDKDENRGVFLNVSITVGRDGLDNAQRMVKALGNLTQKMKLTVAFEEPIRATKDIIDEIKQRNVKWEVLEEEEL